MPDVLNFMRGPLAAPHGDAATARFVAAAPARGALVRSPSPRSAARIDAGEEPAASAAVLRAMLLVCMVAAAVIAWLVAPGVASQTEPALTVLLRGMAAIKAVLALSMAGLVWWRVGQPVSMRVAATYIACASLIGFCTVLIWQLSFIPAAAVLFHAAGLIGLVLAWRDGLPTPRLRRPADSRLNDRRRPTCGLAR